MTFTSEFEVYDEVYTIMNDVITKCSVRAVRFPEVSRYSPKSLDNNNITYGILPYDSVLLAGGVSEGTDFWIWKRAAELGNTKRELLNKMLSNLEEE